MPVKSFGAESECGFLKKAHNLLKNSRLGFGARLVSWLCGRAGSFVCACCDTGIVRLHA